MEVYVKRFNIKAMLGENWTESKGEADLRVRALGAVDLEKTYPQTCLGLYDTGITGEEKLQRLIKSGDIRLGAETFLVYRERSGHIALEYLYRMQGVSYLDFFGNIIIGPGGRRYVMTLVRDEGDSRWSAKPRCLKEIWTEEHFTATIQVPKPKPLPEPVRLRRGRTIKKCHWAF